MVYSRNYCIARGEKFANAYIPDLRYCLHIVDTVQYIGECMHGMGWDGMMGNAVLRMVS